MDNWLRDHLVCPRDKKNLRDIKSNLVCENGHTYPVVNNIPIMLVDDVESTHGYIEQTLDHVANIDQHRKELGEVQQNDSEKIDDFVQGELPYSSGNLYFPIQNKLERYPIPILQIPEGEGERFLDIGCNWGRWSVAAAQKNYKVIGMDPSIKAVFAARRVARQLGVEPNFIVGDSRFLPFADSAFEVVFSYSVIQHFSKYNAKITFDEISRVLQKNSFAYIQMPNRFGVRQYYNHWRRGFTEGEGFEVRYWTPGELLKTFEEKFGETRMFTDCYFGLGIQKSDLDLMPIHFKAVVYSSELIKKISKVFTPLIKVADSVYLVSRNQK